jgi:uncharacterized membrane protein HdeD (DUF308 family)
MATGGITVDGKEKLFIYRKAPSGIGRYLKSVYLRSLMILGPITGIPTMIMILLAGEPALFVLAYTALTVLIVGGLVAFVMGLFLVNPAYSDRSPRLWVNLVIVLSVQILVFVISMFLLAGLEQPEENVWGFPAVLALEALLTWLVGGAFLLLGKWRLKAIE